MEFDPTASVEMVNVVFPPLSVPVPNVVPPFLNVTVPVAAEGVTVAVKVTELPYVDGFNEEVSVTEEEDLPYIIPVKATQPRKTTTTRNTVRITIGSPGNLDLFDDSVLGLINDTLGNW